MRYALLLLLFALPPLGAAAGGADLYLVSRPVMTQSVEERRAAAQSGLAEVMVRVSGRQETLDNPQLRDALVDAERYLLEYTYFHTDELIEGTDPQTGETQLFAAERLQMRFPPTVVLDLLRTAGEPVLPSNRPATLVWIAIDDGSRDLLGTDTRPELAQQLRDQAKRRGVRLLLPLLDLEDSMRVGPETVWRYDEDAVYDASERYDTESLLIARLFVSSAGEWVGDWRYDLAGGSLNGDARTAEPGAILGMIVDQIAEVQSQLYAVYSSGDDAQALSFRVEEVRDFGQYMLVTRYLQGLTAVREAIISRVQGSVAEFLVLTDSDIAALRREIELSDTLAPMFFGGADELHYRLNGQSAKP